MIAGRRISVRMSFVWSMTAARSFFWRATRPWSSAGPCAEISDGVHSEPCVLQRLLAIEVLDARFQVDGYVDRLVEHPLLDVDRHAAEGVDDGGKPCGSRS